MHYPKYHSPATVWTAFSGVTNFESYVENFVVKGMFHGDVPPEITKSYTTVEHIMAHAYYHYPAMDEALVKLLRLLEMAVKIRCQQLSISIESADKKGRSRKKNLSQLINDLANNEQAKPVRETLDRLRELRNILMHPEQETLFGSSAVFSIRQSVIMLNALFLPDSYFQEANAELERIQTLCYRFDHGLFVLEHANFRYIVHKSQFIEAYLVEGEWLILCAFHAVPANAVDMLSDNQYPRPLVYVIKDIQISETQISGAVVSGTVAHSGLTFILSLDDTSENRYILGKFEQVKSKMDNWQKGHLQLSVNSEIGEMKTESRYLNWPLVDYPINDPKWK